MRTEKTLNSSRFKTIRIQLFDGAEETSTLRPSGAPRSVLLVSALEGENRLVQSEVRVVNHDGQEQANLQGRFRLENMTVAEAEAIIQAQIDSEIPQTPINP